MHCMQKIRKYSLMHEHNIYVNCLPLNCWEVQKDDNGVAVVVIVLGLGLGCWLLCSALLRLKGLPPGTMGLPLFGETSEFLRGGPIFMKNQRARWDSCCQKPCIHVCTLLHFIVISFLDMSTDMGVCLRHTY